MGRDGTSVEVVGRAVRGDGSFRRIRTMKTMLYYRIESVESMGQKDAGLWLPLKRKYLLFWVQCDIFDPV